MTIVTLEVIKRIVKDLPNAKFLFLGCDNLNGQIQKNIVLKKIMAFVLKYLFLSKLIQIIMILRLLILVF